MLVKELVILICEMIFKGFGGGFSGFKKKIRTHLDLLSIPQLGGKICQKTSCS